MGLQDSKTKLRTKDLRRSSSTEEQEGGDKKHTPLQTEEEEEKKKLDCHQKLIKDEVGGRMLKVGSGIGFSQ